VQGRRAVLGLLLIAALASVWLCVGRPVQPHVNWVVSAPPLEVAPPSTASVHRPRATTAQPTQFEARFRQLVDEASAACGLDSWVACDGRRCAVASDTTRLGRLKAVLRRPENMFVRVASGAFGFFGYDGPCDRAANGLRRHVQYAGVSRRGSSQCFLVEPVTEPRVEVTEAVESELCDTVLARSPQ